MKNLKKLVEYWLNIANRDFKTMVGLFKLKRYPESLFYGHMVLEKILKALVAQNKRKHASPTHNLLVLLTEAEINLSKEKMEFLAEVSKLNIRTRYPDYKLYFYKVCNRRYTEERLKKIKEIYKELCQRIKKN